MLDPREIQAALAWTALPGFGAGAFAALCACARESGRSLAELWQEGPETLAPLRLSPRARAALDGEREERWERAGAEAARLAAWGVDLLLALDPHAPAVLRRAPRSWPLLFACGALGLLETPRVALLASRAPSPAALAATDALADALARRDIPLLASTHRPAYQVAATAAKRHAGPALLVLDRGLAEAFPAGIEREPVPAARVWSERFDPDLQLLLSPFPWRTGWTPQNGPRRDALIVDLADAIFAVHIAPGGTMERECRGALRRGKPVFALDFGEGTPEATRQLWEEAGAVRIPWRGAEAAVAAALRSAPALAAAANPAPPAEGWLREIGQFLARACVALEESNGSPRAGSPLAEPPGGLFGEIAAAWRRGPARRGAAPWLLADLLSGEGARPERVAALLERVAPGGLVAALLPAEWLERAELAPLRDGWLRRAELRMALRLPQPAGAAAAPDAVPAAAVLLQRAEGEGDRRASPAAVLLTPGQERMGRFHLRRYLQEALRALCAARPSLPLGSR